MEKFEDFDLSKIAAENKAYLDAAAREHVGPIPVKVIFHDPATIVYWADGTKTVVNCQEGDTYSKETGLALCFMKKACGNNARFNNMMRNCIYDAYLHQGGESHEDD